MEGSSCGSLKLTTEGGLFTGFAIRLAFGCLIYTALYRDK